MDNSKARTELSANDAPPVWACLLTDTHVGQSRLALPTDVLATDARVGQLEAELWRLASGIGNFNIC